MIKTAHLIAGAETENKARYWAAFAWCFTFSVEAKANCEEKKRLAKPQWKKEMSVCLNSFTASPSICWWSSQLPRPMCASTCEKSGLMKLLWPRLFMQKEQQCRQCGPPLKLRFPVAFCCVWREKIGAERGGAGWSWMTDFTAQNTTSSRLESCALWKRETYIKHYRESCGPFSPVWGPYLVAPMCIYKTVWLAETGAVSIYCSSKQTVSTN